MSAVWVEALVQRHTASLTRGELLRAIRALSARYVERRSVLHARSPIDSAGKRAAFAAFYAPLHFYTTQAVVRALGAAATSLDAIIDLGCGTGAASAAWALEIGARPRISGVDKDTWALAEAAWNFRELHLTGRTRRGDLIDAAARVHGDARLRAPMSDRLGIVAGWSVNELDRSMHPALLRNLLTAHAAGACVLVLEPLARGVTPWWDSWAAAVVQAGGRADEWKFDVMLPAPLAALDDEAGFKREGLGARSLWLPSQPARGSEAARVSEGPPGS